MLVQKLFKGHDSPFFDVLYPIFYVFQGCWAAHHLKCVINRFYLFIQFSEGSAASRSPTKSSSGAGSAVNNEIIPACFLSALAPYFQRWCLCTGAHALSVGWRSGVRVNGRHF